MPMVAMNQPAASIPKKSRMSIAPATANTANFASIAGKNATKMISTAIAFGETMVGNARGEVAKSRGEGGV